MNPSTEQVAEVAATIAPLRYLLDMFDECDNLARVLGRTADLAVAYAVFDPAVAKYPVSAIRKCEMRVPMSKLPPRQANRS